MTKLEKELKRREQRRLDSLNKMENDLAEDALRALWSVVLVLIGIVLGFYMAETRSQAAETASIPPRCEYVGVMPTEPQTGAQPPTGVNETQVATMPPIKAQSTCCSTSENRLRLTRIGLLAT